MASWSASFKFYFKQSGSKGGYNGEAVSPESEGPEASRGPQRSDCPSPPGEGPAASLPRGHGALHWVTLACRAEDLHVGGGTSYMLLVMYRATLQVSPENTPGHGLSVHMGFREEMAPLSSHNRGADLVSGPLLFLTPLIKPVGTTSPHLLPAFHSNIPYCSLVTLGWV